MDSICSAYCSISCSAIVRLVNGDVGKFSRADTYLSSWLAKESATRADWLIVGSIGAGGGGGWARGGGGGAGGWTSFFCGVGILVFFGVLSLLPAGDFGTSCFW